MTQRKPFMAANWKMYKTSQEAADFIAQFQTLLTSLSDAPDIVICPPYTALDAASKAVSSPMISLGAQTMNANDEGAYTGDISPKMLLEFGVKYVVLGHSERRQYQHETDQDVRKKIDSALKHGLIPIACVGESLAQREAGETDSWIEKQVKAATDGLSDAEKTKLVVAYEPVWAIGTGKVCEASEANRVIGLIRKWIGCDKTRVLYGGSMKPDNVQGLMAESEIDGGLVGGASLDAASFFQLVQAAVLVGV